MTYNQTDVLILCGGQGSRLKKIVYDRPKPMAEINGNPFLDILINQVASYGFNRFILCTGYKAEFIEDYYHTSEKQIEIVFSKEKTPLGTGGAIKNAESVIKTSPFLVLNGDSFCPVDLKLFVDFHKNKHAHLSVVVTRADNNVEFGSLLLDESKRIIRFEEKATNELSYINAGIYLFEKEVLSNIPENTKFSLENELFARLIGSDFFGFETEEKLIDIGTPVRYEEAKKYIKL